MKEIKDLHLKVDAVMALFEVVLASSSHDHFSEFEEEILEKSKKEDDFLDLNEELATLLVDTCIRFLYEDVLSKAKYKEVKEAIFDYIEAEIESPDVVSERALNIQRLLLKHLNAMGNFADISIDNLAKSIKINIK